MNTSDNPYAQSDREAEERFQKYKQTDPFPEIIPALLNSADICDYVAATGMIYPFHHEDNKKFKPASYAVSILGKLLYYDGDGKKQVKEISYQSDQKEFTLKSNSIAFVTLEPMFRIPDYIALRFNLKITHIYRGLLLGTGPLVDPGFCGHLSIPLHNLTNNDYTFSVGEDLIWMEFTKLSPNPVFYQKLVHSLSRKGKYCPFPSRKSASDDDVDVEDYVHKALKAPQPSSVQNSSVQSSIPKVFRDTENQRKEVQTTLKEAETTLERFKLGGYIAGIALLIALFALAYQVNSLVQDSVNYVKNFPLEKKQLEDEIEKLRQDINCLNQEINRLHNSPAKKLPKNQSNGNSQNLLNECQKRSGK
jgi:deoxycytidine triphosphate deaminase/cell division protein FtsB